MLYRNREENGPRDVNFIFTGVHKVAQDGEGTSRETGPGDRTTKIGTGSLCTPIPLGLRNSMAAVYSFAVCTGNADNGTRSLVFAKYSADHSLGNSTTGFFPTS